MNGWAERTGRSSEKCTICGVPVDGIRVYYVTELERDVNGNEQPVCGQHVE